MLHILAQVEKELPELLRDPAGWKGLFIDYHPPAVERLWRPWREYRISLHRIHPCAAGEALFHPHPWPSAMHILAGEYEMAVGFGPGATPPPFAALMVARDAFAYEMTHPDAWHYVRPLNGPTMSVMVTGQPWERWAPPVHKDLPPLTPEQSQEILEFFQIRYPLGG